MSAPTSEPSSASKTVARAGGIMVASLLLSRILGLLRDTVIASHFGLRLDNDAYRIAIQVPDLLFMLIAGGGLSSAFIPVFAEYLHTNREREAWKVFSVVVTICSLIVTCLIALAWVFSPQIVGFIGHGQDPAAFPLAVQMSRIMVPAQFPFLVGSVLIATLYARRHFVAPGLAPNVYNIGIIVGAAVLPGIFGFGIVGVAWGALVGAVIGNLIIPILVMIPLGGSFRPSFDVSDPGVKKFFVLLLPVLLGFSLPSMVTIITQKFASGYGVGANTVLSYANNLMQAPNGIFGQSLALAAFPVLAQFVAQNRMDLYRSEVSKTLRTVLYLGIPSSAILFSLAPEIVDVIYGYGKAKDPEQLAGIAGCLRIYCVGIFAWVLQPVLMRGFFSLHKTLKPIAIGTVATILFVVICVALRGNPMGYYALPWATNVAAILLVFALYFALEGDVGKLDRTGIVSTFAKSLFASVVMGAVAYGASALIQHPGKLVLVLQVGFSCCICGWIYYFVTKALGMPETAYVSRAMDRINRKPRPITLDEAGSD